MTNITPLRMSHTWAGCSKRLSLKYKGQKVPLNVIYPQNTNVTKSIGIYRSCESRIDFNVVYYCPFPCPSLQHVRNTMTMIHIYRSHSWTGSHSLICHIHSVTILYLLGKSSHLLRSFCMHTLWFLIYLPSSSQFYL